MSDERPARFSDAELILLRKDIAVMNRSIVVALDNLTRVVNVLVRLIVTRQK